MPHTYDVSKSFDGTVANRKGAFIGASKREELFLRRDS